MNLAEHRARNVRQSDRMGHRSSIIDSRRNTNAPALISAARTATARRGDLGGAEALMRTLGMVQDAGEELRDYATNKHVDAERDNIAQGAADQATGAVDESMMERSLGYRNAVTKGRTVTEFTKATREFSEELDQLIEGQDSPDLEERRVEVQRRVESFFADFATDPETGDFKAFLQSPDAMRYLAASIQDVRPRLEAQALARIEERFNAEAVSHYGQNIVDQARESGGVDLTAALSLLPETVPDEEISEATITSIYNAAVALRANGKRPEALKLIAGLRGYMDKPLSTGPLLAATGSVSATAGDLVAFRLPVQGRVTSKFGEGRSRGSHNGVDIAVPVGTPVPAAMGGEVIRVWNSDRGGLSVKVKYDDGTVVGFAHLDSTELEKGQRVAPGDEIAKTGNSGDSSGPHLHYTMTRNGKKIDPTSAELGELPEPTPVAPEFRLTDPNASLVSALEQRGEVAEIVGLEAIQFSPEQVAQVNSLYRRMADEIEREWDAAEQERQSTNATTLMLGLLQVSGRTTREDIMSAYESGDIDDGQVVTLVRAHEAQLDRAEARREQRESRAEREEQRRLRRAAERGAQVIVGRMLRGALTPAEARQAALSLAPEVEPEVAVSILSGVSSAASSFEQVRRESAPVRRASLEYQKLAENAERAVGSLSIPPYRRKIAAEAYGHIIDSAHAEFMRRVIDGEKPDEVNAALAKEIAREIADLERELSATR